MLFFLILLPTCSVLQLLNVYDAFVAQCELLSRHNMWDMLRLNKQGLIVIVSADSVSKCKTSLAKFWSLFLIQWSSRGGLSVHMRSLTIGGFYGFDTIEVVGSFLDGPQGRQVLRRSLKLLQDLPITIGNETYRPQIVFQGDLPSVYQVCSILFFMAIYLVFIRFVGSPVYGSLLHRTKSNILTVSFAFGVILQPVMPTPAEESSTKSPGARWLNV